MTVAQHSAVEAQDRARRAVRTAALAHPDDLSDLDIEHERQEEVAYVRRAGRPKACGCPAPVVDASQDEPSCFRCGRPVSIEAAPTPAVAAPPSGTTDGTPAANAPANCVPWSAEQERRLRDVARRQATDQWTLGDLILEAVPNGRTRATNGTGELLSKLAGRIGMETANVRRLRAVAFAWPAEARVDGVSFSAHGAYTLGGPGRANERAAVLRRLAESGPVSPDRVRSERRLKRRRPKVDPLRNLLDRVGRLAARAAKDLPSAKGRAVSPTVCARRAAQLRALADVLDGLAVDGAVPDKGELSRRLAC